MSLAGYALYKNYQAAPNKNPPKQIEPGIPQTTDAYQEHFDKLSSLKSQLLKAPEEKIPGHYAEIQKTILEQVAVYEEQAQALSKQIHDFKSVSPFTPDRQSLLISKVETRKDIFRAFQKDVTFLNDLMSLWGVRQVVDAEKVMRQIEERYFNLENNKLKLIPMYGYNFLNSMCSVMGALVMISALNAGLPALFHDTFPEVINTVAEPHAHMTTGALINFFKQMTFFGIAFDAVYAGTKGMRCRNTTAAPARAWNKVLDTAGKIASIPSPVFNMINGALHAALGKPWDVVTRYAYRAATLGAMGVVRQIGQDLEFSLNDIASSCVTKIFKTHNPHQAENTTRADTMQKLIPKRVEKTFQGSKQVRPFGNVGDVSIGLLVGGIFDWSVGIIENVMQNIIVKTSAGSLSSKVGAALQNPFALIWHNAAPTAACNVLHSNATARVSQFAGNDDIDVVMSRFALGVIKGSLLTALITNAAINGSSPAATAIYLTAQLFIGANSILLSKAMTNPALRSKVSRLMSRIKQGGKGVKPLLLPF
ncbi:MAG: hypothetical protein HQM16_07315 [Deltaproteobacteria bacterium]|nr:hypothetical protein [Deltaproteobacteria bacterium]